MLYGDEEFNLLTQCTTTATAAWWGGARKLISLISSHLTQSGKAGGLPGRALSTACVGISDCANTANYAISVGNCELLNAGHNGFNNGGGNYNYRSLRDRSEIYKLTRQQQEDASVIGKM